MFEMREVFRNIITKRLADAPVGPAKGELIEELTDNLLCRYNDLVAAGVDPGEAETQALDALGELTGRTAREEIVSRIFSRFCVGK